MKSVKSGVWGVESLKYGQIEKETRVWRRYIQEQGGAYPHHKSAQHRVQVDSAAPEGEGGAFRIFGSAQTSVRSINAGSREHTVRPLKSKAGKVAN